MSSETGEDSRPARLSAMANRPSEPEHLPCPRCDSTNTKFCYYNNYNLSQPRHFCKGCRRYWTRGGTLRNVPVGGGSRKPSSTHSHNKRPRTTKSAASSPTATTPTTTASSSPEHSITDRHYHHHDEQSLHGNPVSMIPQMGSGSGPMTTSLMGCEVNLNEAVPEASNFMFPFGGGYGLGLGPSFHGLGFGLGGLDWPIMETVGNGGGGSGGEGGAHGSGAGGAAGGGGSSSSAGCNNHVNTWQMGGGVGVEGGLGADGSDCCFGWPELAISMPGKGLK